MIPKITRRFVLHVGFSCNERCIFCYYRESLEKGTVKDLTTHQIKKRLGFARKFGKTAVDFSGGEPTIRKDLPEVIRYAKKIGFADICVITNGLMMANYDYCKELLDAGLTDTLFSLHGSSNGLHDYLTRVPGSYEKLLKAMDNMKKLKFGFRINTVISNLNFKDLDNYFGLLKKYGPRAINLLVFNPAEETIKYREDDVTVEDYKPIGKSISDALDKYEKDFQQINVRFLPFCLMKGHEKNVRTMWQKIYEKEEWDPILFMIFRMGYFHLSAGLASGFLLHSRMAPKYGKRSLYAYLCEMVQCARIYYNKAHLPVCKKCSLKGICPGINKAYVKKFNKTVLEPYTKRIIKNPVHFFR